MSCFPPVEGPFMRQMAWQWKKNEWLSCGFACDVICIQIMHLCNLSPI